MPAEIRADFHFFKFLGAERTRDRAFFLKWCFSAPNFAGELAVGHLEQTEQKNLLVDVPKGTESVHMQR